MMLYSMRYPNYVKRNQTEFFLPHFVFREFWVQKYVESRKNTLEIFQTGRSYQNKYAILWKYPFTEVIDSRDTESFFKVL